MINSGGKRTIRNPREEQGDDDDEQSNFSKLLINERSFDSLFSDILRIEGGTIFYNKSFSDDPLFNHLVIDDNLLAQTEEKTFAKGDEQAGPTSPSDTFRKTLMESKTIFSAKLSAPCTLFVEEFWKNADVFQKASIDLDFRIIEQMNILSKPIGEIDRIEEVEYPSLSSSKRIKVLETNNIDLWNKVFVESYSIPPSWNEELLRRLRYVAQNSLGVLLLAVEAGMPSSDPSGCLLLHREPADTMGIYCVGTRPKSRGKGVASSLLHFSEKIAFESSCREMTLQTILSDNVTPLYLKHGYSIRFRRNLMQAY